MMNAMRKYLLLFILIILFSFTAPRISYAWSPSPYTFTFVFVNPPDDLEITPISELEERYSLRRRTRLWETRFTFTISYHRELRHEGEISFQLSSEQHEEFVIILPVEPPWRVVVYVDLTAQTFTVSPPAWRNVAIIIGWVVPLILLEILLFFAFGYRKKESWKLFAIENSIAQGFFVGVLILSSFYILRGRTLDGFLFFLLIVAVRSAKLITESIMYPLMAKEHSRGRGVGYALTVNSLACFVLIILAIIFPTPA